MVAFCGAGESGGAGFEGGFCAGVCPKADESGPAASIAARKKATKDRPVPRSGHFALVKIRDRILRTCKEKDLAVLQRFIMMTFPLKILSQRDVFGFDLEVSFKIQECRSNPKT